MSNPNAAPDECPMCEPGKCPGGAHGNALCEDGIHTREQYLAKVPNAAPAKKKELSPYQRIMRAAKRGTGVHLTAYEVQLMCIDTAITDLAWSDDHKDDTE